jgi:NADPH2:quinone reductase
VNYPDGLLVQGLYQMKPETPFIPGMEAAAGSKASAPMSRMLKPGDRVVAMIDRGAYAQKVLAPKDRVFPCPTDDYDDACALMCAWGTSHHALRQRAQLKKTETLLVLGGAGSTGLAAISIGKAIGARVIAVASTAEKRTACLKLAPMSRCPMRVCAKRSGRRPAEPASTWPSTRSAAPPSRSQPAPWPAMDGCWWSASPRARSPSLPSIWRCSRNIRWSACSGAPSWRMNPKAYAANNRELFAWHSSGLIKPRIDERRRLSEAAEALQRILDRGAVGKTILIP